MSFTLEPIDDPVFDHRLILEGRVRDRWLVLRYRTDPAAAPLRPMIRFLRSGHEPQDVVLPGVTLDAASWLGLLPADLDEIRLATGPGFVLEQAVLRGHLELLAECLGKRPIRVVPALYNRLRGDERRFRDILRGACAVSPIGRYPAWRARRLRPGAEAAPRGGLAIRLVVPARREEAAAVARTLDSLVAQSHVPWSATIAWSGGVPDPGAIGRLAGDSRIEHTVWDAAAPAATLVAGAAALGFLCPGDALLPDALAILAGRLAAPDAPEAVYADEEVAGAALAPRLKPDWSPDLALVSDYLGRPLLLSRVLCERLGQRPAGRQNDAASDPGPASDLGQDLGPDPGFGLAAMSAARSVAHVPRILCRTWEPARPGPGPLPRLQALERHLTAVGCVARAESVDGVVDLRWPVPEPAPLVSIVIPSRDRPDLIARVTTDVLQRTDYPAIELVIVDNGSRDPEVLRLYELLRADPRVRIEPYPHPFNFSAMTNAGARAASGDVLVLLNNDVAVLDPCWLVAMVGQAVRPDVGAVGAKLLYEDGTLQHAGVVVGLGGRAGHILRRRPGDASGHLGRLSVAHEVSAVTAACLAVTRAKYDAVGGLDETTFPIDFNDVDLCLRLSARGLRTIWTPKATLSHLESVSRGRPKGEDRRRFEREAAAFASRWRDVIRHDPYYHPALSLTTFGEDLE